MLEEKMRNRITRALDNTWQSIGPDALQGLESEGEPPVMERQDVIDFIMDYLESYGQDNEAIKIFRRLSETQKQAILREAFPYETYTW